MTFFIKSFKSTFQLACPSSHIYKHKLQLPILKLTPSVTNQIWPVSYFGYQRLVPKILTIKTHYLIFDEKQLQKSRFKSICLFLADVVVSWLKIHTSQAEANHKKVHIKNRGCSNQTNNDHLCLYAKTTRGIKDQRKTRIKLFNLWHWDHLNSFLSALW